MDRNAKTPTLIHTSVVPNQYFCMERGEYFVTNEFVYMHPSGKAWEGYC